MTRNATRRCIEWAPGAAAMEALAIAERLFPDLPRQSVIDRLVLTGLHALRYPPYSPPPFHGRDRDRWRLPPGVRLDDADPGKAPLRVVDAQKIPGENMGHSSPVRQSNCEG